MIPESARSTLKSYRLEVMCEYLGGGDILRHFCNTVSYIREGFVAVAVLERASKQFMAEGVFGKNVWYPPHQIRSIHTEEIKEAE